MPDTARADTLIGLLRNWLTPETQLYRRTISAPDATVELPDVPPAYPFNNPITPTKEIDEQVRRLRSIAPGAGTKVKEITNIAPPAGIMQRAMHDLPNYARGNDLNNTSIMGATDRTPGKARNVYINPHPYYAGEREATLVHELTHAASYGHGEDDARSAERAYNEYQALQQAIREAAIRARKK